MPVMGWMSPREMNDDASRWLAVPHELHEALLPLQEKLFPGFVDRLAQARVHCLRCEGEQPLRTILRDTGEVRLCTGYVGEPGNPERLWLQDVDRRDA